jgi:hypothetical protein
MTRAVWSYEPKASSATNRERPRQIVPADRPWVAFWEITPHKRPWHRRSTWSAAVVAPLKCSGLKSSDSQLGPLRNYLGLPPHLARLCHQNKARAVAGIVIEAREVRQPECVCGIGDAPGVAAPHIGIRNKMTAPLRPVPNASDTSFRAVHTNKHQVDLVSSGFGFAQEIDPARAGQSCLDSETRALIEVSCCAVENVFCCNDGYLRTVQRVQLNGDRVGIQQPVVALEIHEPRNRRFPEPFGPEITVRVGTLV